MINSKLILDRSLEIKNSIERLNKFQNIPLDKFLNNEDLKDIASFRLIKVIEGAIAICQNISAKHLKKAPESFADCFQVLSESKIIDHNLAKNLQQMARFRNMLIHVYWNMDYEQIYDIITNHLGDVTEFLNQVNSTVL